jgi:TolB protein
MNSDGSEETLTSDGHGGPGTLSPDGTKVVFSRLADHALYVVEAKGGTPRLIATSEGYVGSPAWSPDGSRIAFTVYNEFDPKGLTFEIWIVNPDGTDSRQLVDLGHCGGGGCVGGLAWSPDASMLAFDTTRDIPLGTPVVASIYVVRADGSGLHRINDDGFEPSWSPDGTRIAFLRDYGFAELGLYTMARDGSDVRRVEGVFVMPASLAWNPVH